MYVRVVEMAASGFEIEAMVRGYHKYKDIWDATVGEQLQCQRENGNIHDIYAVSVQKSGVVVGYVPRKISSICSLFLRRGGAIHCIVTGTKRFSADLDQGGLEVPCILRFECSNEQPRLLDKTQKLVSSALSTKDKEDLVNSTLKDQKEEDESDNNPKAKKRRLSECETLPDCQRDVMEGGMLSDIPINVAQLLLKKQFPNLKGLQPTVYQQRKAQGNETSRVDDDDQQLQIIHCCGNHWIVASRVGCTKGTVNIYDSLYTSLDEPTKLLVSAMFQSNIQYIQPLQKQIGVTDCGLFAIAVITAIAYGTDPSQLQFKQEEMRKHLLTCFNNEYLTPFPCTICN